MTLPDAYFNDIYADSADPWGFTDRWYEERKRAVTLAALPERRYASAYEPGCSIGVLTAALAPRCDALLASDVSPGALAAAADRLAGSPHVRFELRALPHGWPTGSFDLVVLSEVLYYLGDDDLRTAIRRAVEAIAPGGTLLAVHWRHPVQDYPQSGDSVQRALAEVAQPRLIRTVWHQEADLDLSVHVRRRDGEDTAYVSVAARAGLC